MKRKTRRRRVTLIFADIDELFDAFTSGDLQSFSSIILSSVELSHDESVIRKRTHPHEHEQTRN